MIESSAPTPTVGSRLSHQPGSSVMRRATLVCLATLAVTLLVNIASVAAAQSGVAVEHSVTVDGISRKYLVFAPKGFDKPLPVVLAFHGGGSNARQMERYTRFNDLAAKEGFLVVYPEAVDGNWNDGRGIAGVRSQQENIDDVKFVRTIVDRISKEHKIDRSRIFSTGISNGAFMSHRLATEASDLIAAIAPVVGGMAPAMAKKFHPDSPGLDPDHPGGCRSPGPHSWWHGRFFQGQ